jgi:type IV secretory pathway VirJ component
MKHALAVLSVAGLAVITWAQQTQTVSLRGREQTLHIYGSTAADPVIVTSGDGGWIHLAPHIAGFLSRHGFYVVGFDAKAYLESFTFPVAVIERCGEIVAFANAWACQAI